MLWSRYGKVSDADLKFLFPAGSLISASVSFFINREQREERERERERKRERERGKAAQIRVARTIYFFYLLRVKTGNESLILQKLVAESEMHALNTW